MTDVSAAIDMTAADRPERPDRPERLDRAVRPDRPGLRTRQPLRAVPTVLGDWPVPRTAGMVADARHHVHALAARVVGHGELSGDVEIMAGELLANAVEHGGGDKAQVRVTASKHMLRVEVHDYGTRPPRRPRTEDLLGEHGRGLLIVATFADRWGLDHDCGGTTAWFEVRIP